MSKASRAPRYFFLALFVFILTGPSCSSGPKFGPENGALVIVGGGRVGPEVYGRFIELAGGAEEARLIIVPTAGGDRAYTDSTVTASWKRRGVKNVKMLHTYDREAADSEEFVKDLREATGVWFNGGRQWHLTDIYINTLTCEEFHKVLERGGVIGGSSAGATIQGSYLVRGAPEGNHIMMSPGHEVSFGFLKQSAIDQHIDRRNRWTDLYEVIKRYPELLGIGLSERTAIVVQGDRFEVVGPGKVAIHDARRTFAYGDTIHYFTLDPGDWFDIRKRQRIELIERP